MENKNKENKNSKRGLAFGLGLGLGIPVATVLAAGIVLAIKNRYDKNLVIYTNGVSELEPIEISNDYCFATITAKYKNIDITLPKFGYGISNPNVLATAEKTNNGWNLNMYTGDVDAGSSFQATLICTDSSNHKNRKVVDFYIRRGLDALQWSTEGEYQSTMTDEEMIATFKENNLTKKDGGLLPNDVYNNVDLSIVMVGQDKAIKITTKESSTAYQGETILIISPEQEAEIEGIDSVISSKGGTYNLTVKDSEGNVKNITSAYAEYDPEGIVTVELVDTNKLEITPIEGKEGEVNIRLHVQDDAGFRG
ncbi:MAG: hypothetical protein HUJ52_01815, partial [Malacoplasma sp.]|nr:hypothetical protein [Malacoplasma sp.]